MDEQERRQERHNQEVAARESGRNDSGTQAGSHGVSQHEANQSHNQSRGACFPGYTPVLTPNGWKNISQLDVGDEVMSFNEHGQLRCKEILRVKRHKPCSILTVHTNGDSFDATVSHSIMTNRGWLTVGKLKNGDVISQVDQNQKIQSSVISSIDDSQHVEAVFNLIVSGNYTFVVKGCVAHSFTHFRLMRIMASEVLHFILKSRSRINISSAPAMKAMT